MIITMTEEATDNGVEFERKRTYCSYCIEHSSPVQDLKTLRVLLIGYMKHESPIDLDMEDEGHYEGNLAWDKLTLHYPRCKIEIDGGYNGMWEMKVFGRLRSDAQVDVSNDLLEWLLDDLDERIEDLEEAAL